MPKFKALAHGQIKFNQFNVKYTFSDDELIFERAPNKINTKIQMDHTNVSSSTKVYFFVNTNVLALVDRPSL
jgi:hypothetical protein